MLKGGHLLKICLLHSLVLFISLTSSQAGDDANVFDNITAELKEKFAADIASLNETWQEFVQTESDLNETAALKPWLMETSPGSGVFTFSFAGLAKFKSRVIEMVEQKNNYLAQKAELRQSMMEALFNISLPYFQGVQGNFTSDEIEEQPFSAIAKIFELERAVGDSFRISDSDDSNDEEEDENVNEDDDDAVNDGSEDKDAEVEGAVAPAETLVNSVHTQQPTQSSDEATTPKTGPSQRTSKSSEIRARTTTPFPWYRWKALHKNPWWDFEKAKRRQDYRQRKVQESIEKRQKWGEFVRGKLSEKHALPAQQASPATAGTTAGSDRDRAKGLEDIKQKLRNQYKSFIEALNKTRNAFLEAKEQMIAEASEKPWQKISQWGGFPSFDPEAFMAFKAKIVDMVAAKNKYIAEKATLTAEMLATLRELLAQKEAGPEDEPSKPTASQSVASSTGSQTDETATSLVEEILETGSDGVDDVSDDLPFAKSLMLAAAPPGSAAGAGDVINESGGSASFVALVVFGVVAVLAAVAVVAGVALNIRGRRSPYTRMG